MGVSASGTCGRLATGQAHGSLERSGPPILANQGLCQYAAHVFGNFLRHSSCSACTGRPGRPVSGILFAGARTSCCLGKYGSHGPRAGTGCRYIQEKQHTLHGDGVQSPPKIGSPRLVAACSPGRCGLSSSGPCCKEAVCHHAARSGGGADMSLYKDSELE